ncbi:MAG: cytochrome C-551 [Betaproteobacteria bacterium]|jgi:cytochrome c|nr:cytochrome C-551 [Betaproteobacteria bacterium]
MKSITLAIISAAVLAASGMANAQSGADLAKSKNCMNCHDLEKKKVGPSFKDIAAKNKDNKDAVASISTKLKEGKGHPVKVAASDAELKTLVEYTLSAK